MNISKRLERDLMKRALKNEDGRSYHEFMEVMDDGEEFVFAIVCDVKE